MKVTTGFRHEAFFYDDATEFADRMADFVREGIAADEDIFVVLNRTKTELLRAALGPNVEHVVFGNMEEIGRNPSRIIPEWQAFVDRSNSPRLRGIGEPIWAGRTEVEIAECHVHESLLNVAFADAPAFYLMCPYDATALPTDVIDAARKTHPFVQDGDALWTCSGREPDYADVFGAALGPPSGEASDFPIAKSTLVDLRAIVSEHARAAGLDPSRVDDVVLAVSELASNSVSYGGGQGVLSYWSEPGRVVYEVRDAGVLSDPLVGRLRPPAQQHGGRGLWLVNQLCDLVQMRSTPDGTAVRVHIRFGA